MLCRSGLAGGAHLAALTGFVSGSWGLVALAAVLSVLGALVVRRRSIVSNGDRSYA